MNPIGIVQGRLSPPTGDRIQGFPVDAWREEFVLARRANLQCIEWIHETGTDAANPLRTEEGVAEIRRLAEGSGIGVWSVCADYYMVERAVDARGAPRASAIEHLIWLVGRAGLLGARSIVLPFVDASSLKSAEEIEGLGVALKLVIPTVERLGVELHLETDLEAAGLDGLLNRVSHPLVRATYDIGNSASLGRDPVEELSILGRWLGSVHVKDRLLGGGTVPLGTGAADFLTCFRLIRAAGYRGPFILQAARETGLGEVELAMRNRKFVEDLLAAVAS